MKEDSIIKEAFALRRKLVVQEDAREVRSDADSYRFFDVPRSTFYRWKKAYAQGGKAGLVKRKPIARSHPRQIPPEIVERSTSLQTTPASTPFS